MRSVTALLALTALVAAPVGVIVRPPEPTPSQIITTRWGEFEQRRSSTVDPLAMLLALAERGPANTDAPLGSRSGISD
jgi:hypothetical protein